MTCLMMGGRPLNIDLGHVICFAHSFGLPLALQKNVPCGTAVNPAEGPQQTSSPEPNPAAL